MNDTLKEILENYLYRSRFDKKNLLNDLDRLQKEIDSAWVQIDNVKNRLNIIEEETVDVYRAAESLGITIELREENESGN